MDHIVDIDPAVPLLVFGALILALVLVWAIRRRRRS